MNILYQESDAIKVDFADVLRELDITKDDVTDVIFIVKRSAKAADEDADAQRTLGNGIVWANDETTLLVTFSESDWTEDSSQKGLAVGVNYEFRVGFKTSTTPRFIECSSKDAQLTIQPDFIRG